MIVKVNDNIVVKDIHVLCSSHDLKYRDKDYWEEVILQVSKTSYNLMTDEGPHNIAWCDVIYSPENQAHREIKVPIEAVIKILDKDKIAEYLV